MILLGIIKITFCNKFLPLGILLEKLDAVYFTVQYCAFNRRCICLCVPLNLLRYYDGEFEIQNSLVFSKRPKNANPLRVKPHTLGVKPAKSLKNIY